MLRSPVQRGADRRRPLWALGGGGLLGASTRPSAGSLAIVVAITVALGGITTSAAAYLLTERVMRGATARALAAGPPRRPYVPGMIARSLLAWALGDRGAPARADCSSACTRWWTSEVSRDQLALVILGLGGCALIVGLLLAVLAARAAADPVMSVRDAVASVEEGDLDVEVPVYDAHRGRAAAGRASTGWSRGCASAGGSARPSASTSTTRWPSTSSRKGCRWRARRSRSR